MKTLNYIMVIMIWLASVSSFARSYYGTPHQMRQPDSTMVTVYLYGTDVYMDAESEDHYTLIRDESTGAICYAMLSSDGREYASTGIVYQGGEIPERVKSILKPRLRISKEARDSIIQKNKKLLGKDHQSATLKASVATATSLPDTVYGVCVLIEFADVKSPVTRDQVETLINSDTETIFGNSMSAKKYFSWISGGKLTYINYIPKSFYTAPDSLGYYAPKNATDYTTELFYPVVEAALNSYTKEKDGFDVTDLTTREGGICAINIFYAGRCENDWGTGLWPHQSGYYFNLTKFGFSRYAWHTYQMSDLYNGLGIGTFVHENGHLICQWPDYYPYDDHEDNNATDYNLGDSFYIFDEKNPTYPNPSALDEVGWLTNRIDITNIRDGRVVSLPQGCGNAAVYEGTGTGRYEKYYLEVRDVHHKTWHNKDKGIFIWHYNGKGDNNYEGKDELLDCRPATINNPFWTAQNGPKVFDDSSNPSAKWVSGANSDIYLWDFSDYSTTMTFRCGHKIETPEILTENLPNAGIGNEYNESISCQGGEAPYTFAIESGALPNGLYLDEANGVISGVATEEGYYSFVLKLTDVDGKSVTQEYAIEVLNSEPYSGPIAIPGVLEMEEFDMGGKYVAYMDVDETNEGAKMRIDNAAVYIQEFRNSRGYAIMQTAVDEWTQYTVDVEKSGLYEATFRYSSVDDAKLLLFIDGEKVGDIVLHGVQGANGTSYSRGYSTLSAQLELPKGEHKMRILFDSCSSVAPKLYTDNVTFELIQENVVVEPTMNKCYTSVYPNPSGSEFHVVSTTVLDRIEVYSVSGSLLETIIPSTNDVIFGKSYPAGVYMIKLYSDKNNEVVKIVKI